LRGWTFPKHEHIAQTHTPDTESALRLSAYVRAFLQSNRKEDPMFMILAMLQQNVATGAGEAVNRFTDVLLAYVAPLAAVGTLSMALIELWKKLWDSRTKFQTLRWTEWVDASPFNETALRNAAGYANTTATRTRALSQLLLLCTGITEDVANTQAERLVTAKGHLPTFNAFRRDSTSPIHALFALDLSRMMGSIQDAADVALASPQKYESLYVLMTSGAPSDDIKAWYEEGARGLPNVTVPPDPNSRQVAKAHADRFALLRQFVKRKLDGFQLYAGDRWAGWNQGVANFLGIAIMFSALWWLRYTSPIHRPTWFAIGVFSLFGGILSPVAKDLVTALKRVKDG
jgi:hypothetical protein